MEARALPTADPDLFQLSLRVRHPSMDPAEITRAFGIEPEHFFRAGDPRPSRARPESAFPYPETYWLGVLKPRAALPDMSFPGDPKSQIAQRGLAAATKSLT